MTEMSKIVPFYYSQKNDTEEDKKLLEPFKYIFKCDEKHIFTKLMPAFNYWFKLSRDRYRQINEIMDIMHNVYVLLDDIQDNAIIREGFPAAHTIYGLNNTLNAANYAQFVGMEKLINLHPAAIKIFVEELLEYNRGQGLDMYYKDNFICPTEKAYRIMAIRKSSWVMTLMTRLMKLFSTFGKDCSRLISVQALYRQIADDYCNVYMNKDADDKSYCDDLTEGKFSFMVVHAITNNPDDHQIINILKLRTSNIEMKRHYIQLLEDFGSFKYTKNVLDELDKNVRMEIERLGGNPLLMEIADTFKNQILRTFGSKINN